MEQVQAYIGIRGAANSSQFADVPQQKMDLYQQHWWKTVHTDVRIAKTKWVVLRYPTDSFAQAANMSTAGVRGFLLRRLHGRLRGDGRGPEAAGRADGGGRPRADRRARHRARVLDQGHPGDSLLPATATFPTAKCSPPRSATASTARSASTRSRATRARCSTTSSSNSRTARSSARRPTKPRRSTRCSIPTKAPATAANGRSASTTASAQPMLDTLFDEKIGGSFHLTPGKAYEIADNGNRSRIHWDLVLIQRPDYGGGEIWFDGELLRKDGRFVPDDLQGLNEGL